LRVGERVTFYHEGGVGITRWVRGWRHGVIRAIPIKGRQKGWAEIELPTKLYGLDLTAGRRWVRKPLEKAWCHLSAVNALGDTTYHGATLREVVAERKEQKAVDQKKADKAKKVRRK